MAQSGQKFSLASRGLRVSSTETRSIAWTIPTSSSRCEAVFSEQLFIRTGKLRAACAEEPAHDSSLYQRRGGASLARDLLSPDWSSDPTNSNACRGQASSINGWKRLGGILAYWRQGRI